jgi:hypothetical protein
MKGKYRGIFGLNILLGNSIVCFFANHHTALKEYEQRIVGLMCPSEERHI